MSSKNQDSATLSKNFERAASQVRESTPQSIVELIAAQLDRADDARARIEKEGQVVRDMKGSVIAHPSISIEIAATKLACELLTKHKAR